MLLKYRPEGADERTWTFAPDKLMSSEAEAIERVTGMTYEEFGAALIKGSMRARRALLWVFLKREDTPLRYAQVDFPAAALSVDYEAHELRSIRDAIASAPDLDDDERAQSLEKLDELIEDAEAEAPKAPASGDGSSD